MKRTTAGGTGPRRARVPGRLRDAAEIFGLTVALALAVKTFVVDAVHVPSASMENTLMVGDFVLVNKFAYGASTPRFLPILGSRLPVLRLPAPGSPRRGDVIVFYAPDGSPPRLYVKRLVGLPGDTVMLRGGALIVNGEEIPSPPSAKPAQTPVPDFGPVVVPAAGGRILYFVLGDNRDDSLDSRAWGFVPFERVVGRAMMIYWSVDGRTGIRWGRPGTVIR
jgi:signal peptidase I